MSSRWRAALGDAALVLGSVSLVLLVLESALRLTGFVPEKERAVRRMVDARWTTLLDCFPSNPRGTFDIDLRLPENDARYRRLAPVRYDAIARHHPWAVASHYNALRFRDAPLGPKPPGVRRVVILGDSFAEGQGVQEADTLARVLARLLEERAPGRYEVRNCGRRGTDFPADLRGVRGRAPLRARPRRLHPDPQRCRSAPGVPRATDLPERLDPRPDERTRRPRRPVVLPPPPGLRLRLGPPRGVRHGRRDHALVPRHVERREPRGVAADAGVRARDEAAAQPEGGSAPRRAVASLRAPRARLSVHAGARGDPRASAWARGSRTTTCCASSRGDAPPTSGCTRSTTTRTSWPTAWRPRLCSRTS